MRLARDQVRGGLLAQLYGRAPALADPGAAQADDQEHGAAEHGKRRRLCVMASPDAPERQPQRSDEKARGGSGVDADRACHRRQEQIGGDAAEPRNDHDLGRDGPDEQRERDDASDR